MEKEYFVGLIVTSVCREEPCLYAVAQVQVVVPVITCQFDIRHCVKAEYLILFENQKGIRRGECRKAELKPHEVVTVNWPTDVCQCDSV